MLVVATSTNRSSVGYYNVPSDFESNSCVSGADVSLFGMIRFNVYEIQDGFCYEVHVLSS